VPAPHRMRGRFTEWHVACSRCAGDAGRGSRGGGAGDGLHSDGVDSGLGGARRAQLDRLREPAAITLELAQACFGLNFETMIGLYDRRGDGRICGFGLDRVIVDRAMPEGCSIVAVDELTDEQAQDLLVRAEAARQRPRARR
jgi:hypothetical protein